MLAWGIILEKIPGISNPAHKIYTIIPFLSKNLNYLFRKEILDLCTMKNFSGFKPNSQIL